MRSISLPKQGLSPDLPGTNRFKVQGSRVKGNCNGIYRNNPCTATGISGSGPKDRKKNEVGFTLIEVIIALIIVSVLATMIIHTTGGGLWRSARGVGECRTLFELQGRMEQIVQIYKKHLTDGDGSVNLADFRNDIAGFSEVDADGTGFLNESGGSFGITPNATSLFMVTLAEGDQRIASIFAGD